MGAQADAAAGARWRDRRARSPRASRPVFRTAGPHPSGGRDADAAGSSRSRGARKPPAITDALRVAFIAFDLLRDGATDFRDRPLVERRAALEKLFSRTGIADTSPQPAGRAATGARCTKEALARGWEGLIAKHADSLYKSGKRTPDWRKLKIVHEQEFVIGGWTEPRQTRAYFGALLLGVYEGADLVYVGHTGTGFNERELARVMKLLMPLEIDDCPFKNRPKTNERPHWVRPELVAQIKFTEWTADAKLRHPVYLGLRDDKKPLRGPARGRQPCGARLRRSAPRRTREEATGIERRPHGRRRTANAEPRTPNARTDERADPTAGPLVSTSSRRSKRHARTASSSCPAATA